MAVLLIIDVQNDFLPGGSLAVPEGDQVIPVINRLMPQFELVVATQDWHPPGHASFAEEHPGRQEFEEIELDGLPQKLWPVHCVQGTPGAELAAGLKRERIDHIVRKAVEPRLDSYSGFFDNGRRKATGLDKLLREAGADRLFLTGLATDVCVKFTALQARELGWPTWLVTDACRGLDAVSVQQALEEMQQAGVRLTSSSQVPEILSS